MSKEKAVQETIAQGTAAPAVKAKKNSDLMYLGPTIIGTVRHGTVFKDGILPKKVRECVAELPQMSWLFVEVDKMAEAARELKKKQSVLGAIYHQVEQNFMRRV